MVSYNLMLTYLNTPITKRSTADNTAMVFQIPQHMALLHNWRLYK